MARKTNAKTPEGIVRYANVFTARQRKDDKGQAKGDPKFSLLLVFTKKTDLSEMEQSIEEKAVEKFGSKARQLLANGRLKSPIRDAEEYVDEELDDEENFPFNLPGAKMVRFSTTDKPDVVDLDADPIMDKSEFYDGCLARVSYRVYAYDREGNKGVGVALVNVQKMGDGDPLGNSNVSGSDDFADAKPAKGKSKAKKTDDDDDDLLGGSSKRR